MSGVVVDTRAGHVGDYRATPSSSAAPGKVAHARTRIYYADGSSRLIGPPTNNAMGVVFLVPPAPTASPTAAPTRPTAAPTAAPSTTSPTTAPATSAPTDIHCFASVAADGLADEAFWNARCSQIPSSAEWVLVRMGAARDYFKPVSGETWCSMLVSGGPNSKHQWAQSGDGPWITPQRHTHSSILGGSHHDHDPVTGVYGGRSHLSFWGETGGNARGGCCHNTPDGSDIADWGKAFDMCYQGTSPTTAPTVSPTATAPTIPPATAAPSNAPSSSPTAAPTVSPPPAMVAVMDCNGANGALMKCVDDGAEDASSCEVIIASDGAGCNMGVRVDSSGDYIVTRNDHHTLMRCSKDLRNAQFSDCTCLFGCSGGGTCSRNSFKNPR
eukprot:gene28897-biopygen58533